jgi:hypothetical protein
MADFLWTQSVVRWRGHDAFTDISSLRAVDVFRHMLKKKRKVDPKRELPRTRKFTTAPKSMNRKRTRKSAKELIYPLSFVDLRALRGYRFSKIPAAPMPPPTHIVTIP